MRGEKSRLVRAVNLKRRRKKKSYFRKVYFHGKENSDFSMYSVQSKNDLHFR